MVCEPCFLAQNRKRASEIRARLRISGVLFVGIPALLFGALYVLLRVIAECQDPLPWGYAPIVGAIVVCLYWGNMPMGRPSLEDRIRDELHPGAALFGGLIRLVLAGILGVFAAPVGIASSFAELARIRQTLRDVETPEPGSRLAAHV
jgi:hypothetical protein